MDYQVWIQNYGGALYCKDTAIEMAQYFPELILVEGNMITDVVSKKYDEPDWHWWCETKEGLILDPTGPFQSAAFGFKLLGYEKIKTHNGFEIKKDFN